MDPLDRPGLLAPTGPLVPMELLDPLVQRDRPVPLEPTAPTALPGPLAPMARLATRAPLDRRVHKVHLGQDSSPTGRLSPGSAGRTTPY